MLWQIGSFVLLIDIFYRVSVPIDHLFKLTLSDNNTNEDLPTNTTGLSQRLPNNIIIDNKEVSLLLERISLASPEERKSWMQLLHIPIASDQQQAKHTNKNQTATSEHKSHQHSKPSNSTRVVSHAPQHARKENTPAKPKKETQPNYKKGGSLPKAKGRSNEELQAEAELYYTTQPSLHSK